MAKLSPPHCFRSQVLNPILQRQLRGVLHHEPAAVKLKVGDSLEEAAQFYLTHDPLDPGHTRPLVHNLLYVWPVHLSLGQLASIHNCTKDSFRVALFNTRELMQGHQDTPDEEWDKGDLMDYDVMLINEEELGRFFRHSHPEAMVSVSHPHLNTQLTGQP